MHLIYGGVPCSLISKCHKTKSSRTTSISVQHNLSLGDLAEAAKRILQVSIRGFPRQTPHEDPNVPRYEDRMDSRDDRYGGGRARYESDRHAAGGDRFTGDRYGPSDYQNGYGKERGYDRDAVPPTGAGERYGGGSPGRYDGGGGYRERPTPYDRPSKGGSGYRERPGPYDRPGRGGRPSSYDDRY